MWKLIKKIFGREHPKSDGWFKVEVDADHVRLCLPGHGLKDCDGPFITAEKPSRSYWVSARSRNHFTLHITPGHAKSYVSPALFTWKSLTLKRIADGTGE